MQVAVPIVSAAYSFVLYLLAVVQGIRRLYVHDFLIAGL